MSKRGKVGAARKRSELRWRFVEELRDEVLKCADLQHHSWRKRKGNRCEASKGGIWMNFIAYEGNCRVQVYIERSSDSESWIIYEELSARRKEIEGKCRKELRWRDDNPKQLPAIELPVTPDAIDDESQWEAIQSAMIAAMIRFDAALAPYLDSYRAK